MPEDEKEGEALKDQRSYDHAAGPAEGEQKKGDDSKPKGSKGQDSKSEDPGRAEHKGKEKTPLWPWFLAGVVILGFLVVVLWLILAPRSTVRTDDARVRVHFANIAPRVSGQVVTVAVNDNQPVTAGQLLIALDPRDYQTAVQNAQAMLERDQARVGDQQAQVERQPDLIAQAASNVPAAQARLALARANAERYRNLAATGAGSEQDRQQAEATLRENQADLVGARAQVAAQTHQLDILKADRASAQAQIHADEAGLAQAQLNLSYTRIVAPLDGLVGQKSVQVGDIVSPGAPVMTVMPLERAYVEAMYRETALRHVRPGQHVRIHVDAYDVWLDGYVQSLPPASGAVGSPIPPENATGNFTKIVQRLPVKIALSPGQPLARLLRDGFSVETVIDTHLDDVVAAARANRSTAVSTPRSQPPPAGAPPLSGP